MRQPAIRILSASIIAASVTLVAGSGCSSSSEVPIDTQPAQAIDAWQHVHIRVPVARYGEFPEGGGLIGTVDPTEMRGEHDWWLGYFSDEEVVRLRADGFAIEPIATSLLATKSIGQNCTTPAPGAVVDRFCPYQDTSMVSTCKRSIYTELSQASTDFPPIASVPYVQSFDIGGTYGKVGIRAVRVGRIWKTGDPPIPQLVVYGAQHAREWVGPEMIMRLYRSFARGWKNGDPTIHSLLANVAVVFVPVANPDGYMYSHQGHRDWRGNREPCTTPMGVAGIGTDPNRNFETTFSQPSAMDTGCFSGNGTTYHGSGPNSAQETTPLLNLLANKSMPVAGQYATRFALDVHSYGNYVVFPEGLSSDFKLCTTNSNCSAPDLGALFDVMGTELSTLLRDETDDRPFVVGQSYRNLYAVGGDSVAPALYGMPSRPSDPRFLSATAEITNTDCGFRAEALPTTELDALFTRLNSLHLDLLKKIPKLHDGTFYSDYQLPHLHRRQVTGIATEVPSMRVGARPGVGTIDLGTGGTTALDDVRTGVAYRMWRYRSNDPYVFPTELTVCAEKGKCSTTTMGDPGKVDLCDPGRFSADPIWKFIPKITGTGGEECYWAHQGTTAGSITSGVWSLANLFKAKLVYSFRWTKKTAKMRVLVSDNGFVNCSYKTGTGCRIVREYPYGERHDDFRDSAYRSEIIDVSDYDHAGKIQVRFEVTTGGDGFDVFDPVIVGWKG